MIKGADDAKRKAVASIPIPFDRQHSPSLTAYYPAEEKTVTPAPRPASQEISADKPAANDSDPATPEAASGPITRAHIDGLIRELFFSLTSIDTIDPDVELTEQGLDSMSLTELISQLETILEVDLDPDLVFDFPLVDQLTDKIFELARGK